MGVLVAFWAATFTFAVVTRFAQWSCATASFTLLWAQRVTDKKMFTLLDLCVSSLRRGHANLLCIVPILSDDPREESAKTAPSRLPAKHYNHTRAYNKTQGQGQGTGSMLHISFCIFVIKMDVLASSEMVSHMQFDHSNLTVQVLVEFGGQIGSKVFQHCKKFVLCRSSFAHTFLHFCDQN